MSVRLGGIIKQLGDSDTYRLVKGKDVDITEGNAMGEDLADADLFLIDDGAAGTQASTKKSTISRVWTYILSKLSAVTDVSSYSWVLDEDNMSSNSNTKVPTQQSVKAYVDGSSSGLSDVVSDTTPQLGGDLDVNGNDIVSVSNGNIDIKPNGSGKVVIDSASSSSGVKVSDGHVEILSGTGSAGKIDFYCESSAAHKVTVQSPAHSAFSGDVQFTLPASNGSPGQVLKTDGSGNLSYVNQTADTNTTYTPGDGLDLAGTEFAVDLKANGGLVIESTEVAVDLGASSITGTLANSDTTATNANTANAIVARDGSGNFAAGTITAGLTGNASSATALQTARSIGGVSFDGTSDINLPGVNAAGDQDTSGTANTATTATTVTITDTAAAAGTNYITFVDALSGNESVEVESALTYAANTNTISANISGDVSGSSGSCTGNAATATKLATARAINGVNFDGTTAITVAAAGSTLTDTVPVSKGGTGTTTFNDKAVVITQDSGTDTLSTADMSVNGNVLIGGTSGPAASTLTAGSNISITNADGGITIAATGDLSSNINYARLKMGSTVLNGGGSAQDFNSTSFVIVKFDTEEDNDGSELTSNTTTHKITAASAGLYRLTANMTFTSTVARNTPSVSFNVNDVRILGESYGYIRASNGSDECSANISRVVALSANDYVNVCAHDTSTVNGSIFVTEATFEVEKIGAGVAGADGPATTFQLEDGDGTEVTISNGKEVKFIDGDGIDINWTDTSNGSDGDPYDLTFTVDHDAATNYVAAEHYRWDNDISGTATIDINNIPTVPVSKGGTGRTTLDSGLFLLGNGTSAVTSSANLRLGQGAVQVLGTASTDPGQIRIYEASDNGSAFTTIKAPADNSNTNPVITLPVATGTMALTSDIPVHTAGDGLTLTGVDFDVDAAQTTITSVLNANLKVGTASDQEYIDFGAASNVIRMAVNNSVVLDVTSAGVEVSGNVDVGSNNVSVNGNVGDTSNNDFVSFGTDGEVSLVTNNSARLTASDTGVFIEKNLFNKTASTNFTAQGDIVKIGTGSTTQGELCYYKSDGAWAAADADAVATSGGCLLAIALGTDPDVDGMLLRGMFTLDHDPGTIADELYVSTTAGNITGTAPSGNNDVVRIVGYCLDSTNGQIWFNPSNDFIEITA